MQITAPRCRRFTTCVLFALVTAYSSVAATEGANPPGSTAVAEVDAENDADANSDLVMLDTLSVKAGPVQTFGIHVGLTLDHETSKLHAATRRTSWRCSRIRRLRARA